MKNQDIVSDTTAAVAPEGIGTVLLDSTPEEVLLAPAVDAVYTDDDVRLFEVWGCVQPFPEGTPVVLRADNPVVVFGADGKPIGTARVLHSGLFDADATGLVATALIKYSCPERLSIEAGAKLYFHPLMVQEYRYSLRRGDGVSGATQECLAHSGSAGCDGTCIKGLRVRQEIVVSVSGVVLTEDPRVDARVPAVVAPEAK